MKHEFASFLYDAFFSEIKFSVISAGRRTGKTYAGALWLLTKVLQNSDKAAIWIDTTQPNIEKYIDRYFVKLLGDLPYRYDKQRKIIRFPNNSYIDFGSAERPENLEGQEYAFGVLNEAGIILKRGSLWYNTLYPMFKGKDTQVRIIGTPKGKNLFHKLYVLGRNDDEYRSFSFSAFDSPFWDQKELQKVQTQIPLEAWEQEYLAKFIDGAGSVFRNISQCVREPQKDLKVDVMSIDLAKYQDFTVIMLGNRENKQVISMDRFNRVDWSFQKNRIYNAWLKNGKPKVIIDSTGVGDPIYDDLKNAGMYIESYKFNTSTKTQLIQGLSVAMDNAEIFFPSNEVLIGELEVFGYEYSLRTGNVKYSAPEGFHDDCVIALGLMNELIKTGKTVTLTWF